MSQKPPLFWYIGQRKTTFHSQRSEATFQNVLLEDFFFQIGKSKILVATTVIEVGVDVPDATIMVIECVERFGLAQIHQLRGRVGRNDKESSCILLYKTQLSPIAYSRLKILKETDDGFKIAEEDLILRGPGEILGSKQSGNIDFKFVDLHFHSDLITVHTCHSGHRLAMRYGVMVVVICLHNNIMEYCTI